MVRVAARSSAGSRARRAFTLVELLVVITIILILGTAVFIAGGQLRQQGRLNLSKSTLENLDAILQTWLSKQGGGAIFVDESQATRVTNPATPKDRAYALWDRSGDPANNAARWAYVLSLVPECREQLLNLRIESEPNGQKRISDNTYNTVVSGSSASAGGAYVVDGFGTPIMLIQVYPARPTSGGETWLLQNEDRYGSGQGRRYYFLSAGPDRAFGNRAGTAVERSQAADNIFSFATESK